MSKSSGGLVPNFGDRGQEEKMLKKAQQIKERQRTADSQSMEQFSAMDPLLMGNQEIMEPTWQSGESAGKYGSQVDALLKVFRKRQEQASFAKSLGGTRF